MINENWKIIDSDNREDISSSWIEEEEFVLNWAENPVFEKQPLKSISISFIYINIDNEIVGILKSSIDLEKQHNNSILHQYIFLDKVNIAKNPISILLTQSNEDNKHNWLEKSYMFRDAIIYYPSNEQTLHNPSSFHPLYFSNDIAKIPNSISVLHDLYEIVVIMREIKPTVVLKSIIKHTSNNNHSGKTKKVRISDDSPKEIIYVNNKSSLKSKRKTKKKY